MPLYLYSLLLFAIILVSIHASDDELVDALVEWVRSKGGFFSDKLEIQSTGKSRGVFATKPIAQDELLLKVPHSCFLALWDGAVGPSIDP